MSDSTPSDDRTDATEQKEEPGGDRNTVGPPENLPQELLVKRLSALETRRALAELCKSAPGLEDLLLPKGIQADALTRKTGSTSRIINHLTRRVMSDPSAWSAFTSAISSQIPHETSEAINQLNDETLEELAQAHSTENLLLGALRSEDEVDPGLIDALIERWSDENRQERQKETDNETIRNLQSELEQLRAENSRLSFSSQTAEENAEALREELRTLRAERDEALTRSKKAEEQATQAAELRESLQQKVRNLEEEKSHLEQALANERSSYESAAEKAEKLHAELDRVISERDRIGEYLNRARFTEAGFGELLMRSVKNEVNAMPEGTEAMARSARLLEFMGRVLQTHAELREASSPGAVESEEDDESSGSHRSTPPTSAARSLRPTVSFRAIGGSGGTGGSSHLLDMGHTRILVDSGINPNGRGQETPDFSKAGPLDAAVITHAHLDHCGALPKLVRERPGLSIYCTPPSEKLIVSALNEHAAISGGLPGGASMQEVRRHLQPVAFNRPFRVGQTQVTMTESGHILGAASVLVQSESASVFHTGDICLEDHFSIPSARLPEVENLDLLIMEATLADREPQPFLDSVRTMVEVINQTVLEEGGSVLIPTYALGQAQEIILGLKHYGPEFGLDPDVFIYIDGSVVTTSERLYAEQLAHMKPYLQNLDPGEVFFSDNIRAVSNDYSARERILYNPCAIIASPVNMEGGASGFYRKRLSSDPTNALILPSNADALYRSEGERWRIERVGFASHCTQDDLFKITDALDPRQIILIHGSKRRISDLAHRLSSRYKVHTPALGETVRTVVR